MSKLIWPVEPYNVSGYEFGSKVGRWFGLRATHLGDDVVVSAGTVIKSIGEGKVVWSEIRPGSEEKRNWGGIVVIAHEYEEIVFYSVYGHLRDLGVSVGDRVVIGQQLGVVAEGLTSENGWWKIPHLHFAIYTGSWNEEILPGYFRIWERRTKKKWWKNPKEFIENYNNE
jgi:murein DD-endopeptidase MepM/ murein hydrolase activator NlpD